MWGRVHRALSRNACRLGTSMRSVPERGVSCLGWEQRTRKGTHVCSKSFMLSDVFGTQSYGVKVTRITGGLVPLLGFSKIFDTLIGKLKSNCRLICYERVLRDVINANSMNTGWYPKPVVENSDNVCRGSSCIRRKRCKADDGEYRIPVSKTCYSLGMPIHKRPLWCRLHSTVLLQEGLQVACPVFLISSRLKSTSVCLD